VTLEINRRNLFRAAGAAGIAGLGGSLIGAAPASAAQHGSAATAAIPGFPTFNYLGEPLDMDSLRYNPNNEMIFPSVRNVAGRIANPRARWYLYYAPHDNPGGICLAYGDSLSGKFTEYPDNPIISRAWSPHYTVSHVSSPHAYYNPTDRHIYLFFHGENHTTRVARSADGINFQYVNTVVTTAQLPGNVSETSYARVFDHPTKPGMYIMLLMGNQAGSRKIFIGWSHSLTSGWKVKPQPLISPRAGEGTDLSGAHYWSRNGGGYVVYHSGSGNIHVTDVGLGFDRENHLGVLHAPRSGAPDNGRVAAPSFAEENGRLYMFYEAGRRSSTRIAVARA